MVWGMTAPPENAQTHSDHFLCDPPSRQTLVDFGVLSQHYKPSKDRFYYLY